MLKRNLYVHSFRVKDGYKRSDQIIITAECYSLDRDGEVNWGQPAEIILHGYDSILGELSGAVQNYLARKLSYVKSQIHNFLSYQVDSLKGPIHREPLE